jgi:hypothetical protein
MWQDLVAKAIARVPKLAIVESSRQTCFIVLK